MEVEGAARVISLVNPDNLDDWLTEPLALSGLSQPFGPGTWGRILHLAPAVRVEAIELECMSNEALFGPADLTVID